MKKILTLTILLLTQVGFAAKVDTITVYSTAMKQNIRNIVVLPDGYSASQKYPSVYLLHGATGNFTDWTSKAPNILELADQYQVILVCPEGTAWGWYLDSPLQPKFQYKHFISKDLVTYVDKNYSTYTDKKQRAITGLSMGGHGAMLIGLRNQNLFGAMGSMSGVLDLTTRSARANVQDKLGKFSEHRKRWKENSVLHLTHLIEGGTRIIIDCGLHDYLLKHTQRFHQKLVQQEIPHEYTLRPGAHNWAYWQNAVQHQMLYFNNFFLESTQ